MKYRALFKGLTRKECAVFMNLTTPAKIQDFLECLPINFEEKEDTLFSPRRVLKEKSAHCFEGALFACAALLFHGKDAYLLDLKVGTPKDDHHVVALFREKRKRKWYWGAISKTNHAVLRYRDAVYRSPREIALSYFHEYFLDNGEKTLRSYAVFDISRIKNHDWITDEKDIWYMDRVLDKAKHTKIVKRADVACLRKADPIERKAGKLVAWKKGR